MTRSKREKALVHQSCAWAPCTFFPQCTPHCFFSAFSLSCPQGPAPSDAQASDAACLAGCRKRTKVVPPYWLQSGGQSYWECSCERECSLLGLPRSSEILMLGWWLLRNSSTQSFVRNSSTQGFFHLLGSKPLYAKTKDKTLVVPDITKCNAKKKKKKVSMPPPQGRFSGGGIGTQMCLPNIYCSKV